MTVFYAFFLLAWLAWFAFADKSRWRELFLVSLFALFLSTLTDALMHHHKLWEFVDGTSITAELIDDFGLYIVVPYLFIQRLPRRAPGPMLAYWFAWTGLAIIIEWIHIRAGVMTHHRWWTLTHSYLADWLLFWLFYRFHRLFRLDRLSAPPYELPANRPH